MSGDEKMSSSNPTPSAHVGKPTATASGEPAGAHDVEAWKALDVWMRAFATGRSEPLYIARDHTARLAADRILPFTLATPPSPDGYVLVPREPTEAMVAAAVESLHLPWREIQRMLQAYSAMIAAALPTPPLSAHLDAERLVEGRGEGGGSSRTNSGGSPPLRAAKSESGEGH
jgi:hypothetical protein